METSPPIQSQEPASRPGKVRGAIAYWEPRRLPYNLLLVAVALAWGMATWPHFRGAVTPYHLLQLAILALLANLCYSAVYPAEWLLRLSALDAARPRLRGVLWILGTVLAIVLENYWIADEIYPDFH
jgi:hypothetical protein